MDVTDDTGRFDDDRLLSFALGLEPDAELEAALAGDDELRARLEAVRADLAAVEQGLDRVVPAPGGEYTELGAERWAALKPLLQAPATRAPHRRSWLRVLAPVAAVVLVLGVGVVALQRSGTGTEGTSTVATDNAEKGSPSSGGAGTGGGSYGATSQPQTATRAAAGDYEAVVVARAHAPAAAKQVFTVEKVLKGEVPGTLMLAMTHAAVRPDALVILYLLPNPELTSGAPAPSPATTAWSDRLFRYTYRDRPAIAQPLAPGTDPATVALP